MQQGRTEGEEVAGVAPLGGQLNLAQQLHLDAVVVHLLAGHIGHLDLAQAGPCLGDAADGRRVTAELQGSSAS